MAPFFPASSTIILGDFNAKSSIWNSPIVNKRDLVIEELLEEYNYVVINTGAQTYQNF